VTSRWLIRCSIFSPEEGGNKVLRNGGRK